jgi:hypothetical protein
MPYRILPWLLVLAPMVSQATLVPAQERAPEYIAFRFDDRRVIATIKIVDPPASRQVREGLSAAPAARFGYPYFTPPAAWTDRWPAGIRSQHDWAIHTGAGQPIAATLERLVGGNLQCTEAAGVLLRVAPDQAQAFAQLPAKYFIAEPSGKGAAPAGTVSTVTSEGSPALSAELRSALDSNLKDLLNRELPGVIAEAQPDRERQQMDAVLKQGRATLTYDLQMFRLSPDRVPVYFVRAIWLVEKKQAFAAAVWLRGDPTLEIVQTDIRPASWLRKLLFQHRVHRDQLGLVLNVFDRDHDGWGEVLFAQAGYESVGLKLLEYSASGFERTGIAHSFGC